MRTKRSLPLFLPALLVLLALLAAGCKDFSFFGVLGDRIAATPLQIAPAAVSVQASGGTVTFTATGGTAPYSYSVLPGTGTGTIVAGTGAFTAMTAGDLTVRVTDSKGQNSSASVDITPTGASLTISPVNVSLSLGGGLTFLASGGTLPYTFSLTASGSGSPTINVPGSGDYVAGITPGTDTVQVLDGNSDTVTATINVTAATPTVDYELVQASFVIPSPVKGGSAVAGATFRVRNGGIANGVEDISYWVYLSDDGTLGSGDTLLDAGSTGALAMGAWADVSIGGDWPLASGAKNLFVMVSATDDIDAANNTSAASPVTLELPNYQGTLTHDSGTTAGAALTGTLTITNAGAGDGSEDLRWTVYASLGDLTLDAGDKIVASGDIPGGLPASGSSGPIPINGTWPPAAGDYYLVGALAADDEIDTAGNLPFDGLITVAAAPAPAVDYSGALTAPVPTRAGGPFTANLTIGNGPAADGTSTVSWRVYASLGNVTIETGTDKLVGSGSIAGGLPANGSSGPHTISSSWPSATGTYYLVAEILADDETAPANNTPASAAVNVGATDYFGNLGSPGGTAGGACTGSLTISNISGIYALAGSQNLSWTVYASLADSVISPEDKVVGSGVIPGGLAAGGIASPAFASTWPLTDGLYYLVATLSAGDDANAANNLPVGGPYPIGAPPLTNVDYTGVVAHGAGNTAGAGFTGTLTIDNSGTAPGSEDVVWNLYASRGNFTLDPGDTLVDSGTIPGGLPNGASTGPLAVGGNWPALSVSDTYFLVADIQALDEGDPSDNQPYSGSVGVVVPPVDYSGSLSVPAPLRAGGSFSASITISNDPAFAGSRTLYWSVYASLGNATIEAGDKLVASGSIAGGLPAGGSFGPQAFSNTWPAATGDYFLVADIQAEDDIDPLNDNPSSGPFPVGATDYSGIVAHGSGATAGAAFDFSLQINNPAGPYALNGAQDLYWNVYASLGDSTISVDDKVVGSGFIAGGLPAGGSFNSGVLANTWPEADGPYFLVADIFAGDDANAANNRPNTSVAVTAPPPPDYAVTFSTPPAWSAIVGTAIGGQIRIENISGNDGLKPINYSIYRSADKILGGDVLLLSGSQAPLDALDFVDLPAADGDLWPATGQFCFLIATISAADDPALGNNIRTSNPTAVADVRYPEGVEDNDDSGPTPPPFSNVSVTGQVLDLDKTLALEGSMDAYDGYDTYRFLTGVGVNAIRMKARWDTGYDDLDLYLWNASGGEVASYDTDLDSEPAGQPNLGIIGITASTNYFAGANFWLDGGTSGSTGQRYVILLNGYFEP